MNWAHFIDNFIKSLHNEDQQYNTKKEFNCVIVVIIRPSNNLQFQYFGDFNVSKQFFPN